MDTEYIIRAIPLQKGYAKGFSCKQQTKVYSDFKKATRFKAFEAIKVADNMTKCNEGKWRFEPVDLSKYLDLRDRIVKDMEFFKKTVKRLKGDQFACKNWYEKKHNEAQVEIESIEEKLLDLELKAWEIA